ncbi:ABC transporter substrate-binding protein [Peterkaempfera bronchialis]|uniref:ABC transporter substrate-binding protein n=1 Tax=Peterkaempfera bronchialis TaxID=2126346 RepID=A0A345T0A3_9ACTN|nr:ABC transporter substrate-binding protein [Peterkaempfera bronchialis]AXI79408.1 ABC transporter substrate-binding protein [Peterkaempfera bronchialis]
MTARPIRRRTAANCAAFVAGALLLTGCASSGRSEKLSLHDQLPEAVLKAGVLKIGSDINYAPVESKGSDGKAVGLDPDIAAAVGRQLGVRVEFQNVAFEKLIPELQAGDIDLVMSAMSDTRERREGTDSLGVRKEGDEGVDFVDYFIAGTSILVAKGNPENITDLNDLCGKTIALQKETTQDTIASRQQVPCKSAGKPLTVMKFGTDDQALAQLKAGNVVADLNDFPVAAYNAKTVGNGNAFEVAGPQMQPAPYGIAVRKDNTALRDAVAKAVDAVIMSGEYDKILADWNLSGGAVQNAVVNGG